MNDQAIDAHSPFRVRVMRTMLCFGVATAIGWRGAVYFDPLTSNALPFMMCELTAAVLGLLGLVNLCGPEEPGPA